jgi:hypothetical protein
MDSGHENRRARSLRIVRHLGIAGAASLLGGAQCRNTKAAGVDFSRPESTLAGQFRRERSARQGVLPAWLQYFPRTSQYPAMAALARPPKLRGEPRIPGDAVRDAGKTGPFVR